MAAKTYAALPRPDANTVLKCLEMSRIEAKVTCTAAVGIHVNLASDSAALGAHFAVAGDNPATPAMMAALEVTAVGIYGELTPDVEAMVAGMNPTRFVPDLGTFDRRLASP